MPSIDMPLSQLVRYTAPDLDEPEDFDDFWATTMAGALEHDLGLLTEPYPTPWPRVETYDVTFAGFDGTPVKAWLNVPAGASDPLPVIVNYYGYSLGRGFPHWGFEWLAAGYAQLCVDNRGQGYFSGSPEPATSDLTADAGLAHLPGFLTSGILDPRTFYYRRLFTDAARALEAAASLPWVDPTRIAVRGGSQGGATAIAAASLAHHVGIELAGMTTLVPFLCDIPRAIEISGKPPYDEVTRYLAGWRDHAVPASRTLSYFDCVLLGQRATAPALFSTALLDDVCPPSGAFAAYNRYGSHASSDVRKEIKVYPHNGHEGGGPYETVAAAEFLASVLTN